jgi:hypothetical protein
LVMNYFEVPENCSKNEPHNSFKVGGLPSCIFKNYGDLFCKAD